MQELNVVQLRKCPLFRGIDSKDLEKMIRCLASRVETYHKGAAIVLAGQSFHSLGILLEGQAKVVQDHSDGRQLMMNQLSSGDVFGEVEAFSTENWTYTVEAVEVCTVLYLEPCRLIGTCRNACPWHHTLIENLLERIAYRTQLLSRQVYYLTIRSLRGRISALLLEESQKAGKSTFMLKMNRNEMANFLNVARPSLSRELARMRDDGLISYYNSSMRILNTEALALAVES